MWSVKTDIRDELRFHDKEVCTVCGKSHDFAITVEQDYLVIYGMRLSALKKRYVSSCLHCLRRKNISLTDKSGTPDPRYLTIESKPYGTFVYYTGWIVLAALGALVVWLYYKYS